MFSRDPGFVPENTSEFFSEDTRKRWLDIIPSMSRVSRYLKLLPVANLSSLEGLGYLEIKHPEKYDDLPTKLATFDDQFVVTTSMTHQLHCLVSLPFPLSPTYTPCLLPSRTAAPTLFVVCHRGSVLGTHIRYE